MKKKYQVFVSSTYIDLIEERRSVGEALLSGNYIPVGMELFAAADSTQWNLIKQAIDDIDIYIVIIAGRYGSEYRGKSYTRREYEYAIKKKKPVLAFIHSDIGSLAHDKCESSTEKQQKLNDFINYIKERKIYASWKTPDELARKVITSLLSQEKDPKLISSGWVKASTFITIQGENKELKESIEKMKLTERIEIKTDNIDILYINNLINKIDLDINSSFPARIKTPKYQDPQKFSSQLLINSLISLGIPFDTALEILEKTVSQIKNFRNEVTHLTPLHIRKAVAQALFKLSDAQYPQKREWCDRYIRKFGNPNTRTSVLIEETEKHRQGIEYLTYDFVKKTLLPDLFLNIFQQDSSFAHLKNSLRKDEYPKVAEKIVESVKQLNLSRIHYSTLLSLSKDLSLQPPHPWFVARAFDKNAIKYDYGKASIHMDMLKSFLSNKDYDMANQHFCECIHHSSCGILAIYGVFMGCGFLAPFQNLIHNITLLNKNKTTDIFQYSEIRRFIEDSINIGLNLNTFQLELTSLKKSCNWKNPLGSPYTREERFSDCQRIFSVFQDLVKIHFDTF
jgi:hypothetical protein